MVSALVLLFFYAFDLDVVPISQADEGVIFVGLSAAAV